MGHPVCTLNLGLNPNVSTPARWMNPIIQNLPSTLLTPIPHWTQNVVKYPERFSTIFMKYAHFTSLISILSILLSKHFLSPKILLQLWNAQQTCINRFECRVHFKLVPALLTSRKWTYLFYKTISILYFL